MKKIIIISLFTCICMVCNSQTRKGVRNFSDDKIDLYKKLEGKWMATVNNTDTVRVVLKVQPSYLVLDSPMYLITCMDISGWNKKKKGDSLVQSSFSNMFKLDTSDYTFKKYNTKYNTKKISISISWVYKKPFYYSGCIYDISKNKLLGLYVLISDDGTKMEWKLTDNGNAFTSNLSYDKSFVLPSKLYFTRQGGL